MDKKWSKSNFQLLPLDGRYFLTIAIKYFVPLKTKWKFSYICPTVGQTEGIPTLSFYVLLEPQTKKKENSQMSCAENDFRKLFAHK